MADKRTMELECDIHGTIVSVYKRIEMREDHYARVYDIYMGNALVRKGLGEPFTSLSTFWRDGKM